MTAAAVASIVSVHGAGASSASMPQLHTKGAHAASTSGGPLVYQNGPLVPASHTYVIWWGSFTDSNITQGIPVLFGGFGGSTYLETAHQYMFGQPISSINEPAVSDSSPPPSRVSPSTLGNEVLKLFPNIDPAGIYFVYTSNFPKGGNYCAWHSYATTPTGTKFPVAYMPNTTGIAGCNPSVAPGTTTYSDEGLNSLANVTAHEFMEAVTDPLPATGTYGWIDSSGSEIGDKCAWQFNGTVKLANGTFWKLQEEWSNATAGCVETTPVA